MLTAKVASYTFTETATFDSNDLCIKFIEQETYPSKDYANAAWEEYKAEEADDPAEWAKYSKDGKTITYDATEDWKGKSKEEVRQYMEWMLEEYKHWNEGEYDR